MKNEYGYLAYRAYDVSKTPLIRYGLDLGSYHDSQVLQLYRDIIEKEEPISLELLSRRLAPVYNMGRVGKRLKEKVRRVVTRELGTSVQLCRDEFVFTHGMKLHVRYRTEDGFHERDVEQICHEELMEALRLVMMHRVSNYRSSWVRETSKALGFHSHKSKIDDRINDAFDCMKMRGDIVKRDAKYSLDMRMIDFEGYKMGDYRV